jgi:hypothetical protein
MATDTMKLSDELEARIRDALAPLHPEKVILCSSFARQIMDEGTRLI